MAGEIKRATRVAERLREELAFLLSREVKDPRIKHVLISRVEMPDDLKGARVYVRLLENGDDLERRKEALLGLGKAASMIRREVAKRMSLRFAPELRFYYDEGQDKAERIEQLLEEVKREDKARGV
jgi:ribosome-binding factor A